MHGEGRADTAAAARVLSKLAIGHVRRSIRDNESRMRGPNALGEGWQQFQIPISGQAGSVIAWQSVPLVFTYAFHDATSQRDVPFNYPTFVYGYELETPEPVCVHAHVASWNKTPQAAIIGATAAIGAYDPTTNGLTNFSGYAHLMFQGYGALREMEAGDDAP